MEELCSKLDKKIQFGPSYSPWSNGVNERNHASADITIKKLLDEETKPKVQLDDSLVKAAAWTHNTSINRLGFSPMQLATGKSVAIPGLTTGTLATESESEAESVKRIMENLQKTIKEFRAADMNIKLKDCQKIRVQKYQHREPYTTGDKVWYQNKNSNAWSGPVEVFCQKGNNVWLWTMGEIRKVAACRVKPYELKEKENKDDDSKDNDETKKEDDSSDKAKEVKFVDFEKDKIGAYYLQVENNGCFDPLSIFSVEVPVTEHGKVEVIEAKEREMENLNDYDTYDEVKDEGQSTIGSRWVITRKQKHDGQKTEFKARLVARGFQELDKPQSDSPTALRESFKLFMAVAANQDFSLASVDIRAAFLQAKVLDRDVYVKPPKDVAKTGILWKLKKPLYGLDDASRKFWLRIREVFLDAGMKTLEGDEAFYYKRDGNDLEGMVLTHVDDFTIGGKDSFVKNVIDKLNKEMTVSKVERNSFRFTGVDIKRTEEGIEISMNDYADSLEEIVEIRDVKRDEPLTKIEMKLYRKMTGKVRDILSGNED